MPAELVVVVDIASGLCQRSAIVGGAHIFNNWQVVHTAVSHSDGQLLVDVHCARVKKRFLFFVCILHKHAHVPTSHLLLNSALFYIER